ncbi:LamG-like jellyroll fold domain-containing protein [Aquincola sp. J276]|uniref:LamG-like jellyroll fold domain-containing protein n=1 Tax=Aquincola sp. J276 TaxID=2898432 RepID=UPI0021513E8E|nr:LamG-like jellyroll fold domain-containing protein [Aquincola sp. J276]MCR5868673.1 metallophosphoesterase [Aquincola sp. J276]
MTEVNEGWADEGPAEDESRLVADRRSMLRGAAGLSAWAAGNGLMGNAQAAAPAAVTSFAIAVLPDTQFYARYATPEEGQQFQTYYGSTPFAAQTEWIARHAAAYNIPFVIHLGDVVDQQNKPNQWRVADAAMQVLENAGVPYSILAGNHDVINDFDYRVPADQGFGTDAQRNLSSEPYLQWFPRQRAARQATFRERDPSGFHECHVFQAHGISFMVLSLSWRISDAGIAWARSVIARHPTLPVILSNHQLLNIAADGSSPQETEYGRMLWDKLIRDNDQIFMTLNGHHHGAAHLRKFNDFGNEVHQMVVDYQMDYQGGNAMMRLYEVDFTGNRIDVMSFSPWVVAKPKNKLNQFDFAELTQPNQRFSIPVNFKKRFAGFLRWRPVPSTTGASILPRVRSELLAGYVEPVPPAVRPPADANDFPLVADAYAHWRVPAGIHEGKVVQVGEALPDVAGGHDMTRVALRPQASLGDVVWSTDRHYLSSAPGSVRFLNTDKTVGRLNAFLTAAGSSLNGRSFWTGYTFEAFVKIPADWDANKHRWGNLLGRQGNRGNVPGGFRGGDPEASSVLFAISSLREVQWEVVPASNSQQAQTNWSGELIRDTWYHVAIVNDPATATTTMYIEGAPVLRNVANAATGTRSQNPPQPWILGAGWWDGVLDDGFYGWIGELRIVPRPIPAAQWLTARRG